MFKNIYGLSCVENHVLAILKEKGFPIAALYHNSAIPLKELFFFLVVQGEDPYYFYRVPRIQDELKEQNLITLEQRTPKSVRDVRDKIRCCKENEYILLRVSPEFTKEILHARGFRDDHFVRIAPCGREFIVYNDVPDIQVTVSARKLSEIFAGEYFIFTILREINANILHDLWSNRLFKPEKQEPFYFTEADFIGIPDVAFRLRGMISIYKTMRYRVAAY